MNAKMLDLSEQNKRITDKNVVLHEEIEKLKKTQNSLLEENIKNTYYGNRMYKKVIRILEENIAVLKQITASTHSLKEEIETECIERKRCVLKDKNISTRKK